MLSKETRQRLADYFDADEIVDFLRITAEEVIDAFEVEVEEHLADLEEMMGLGENDD